MSNVEILADSLNISTNDRITTFQVKIPKCILAEINTHRMLSRNAASSRAIPIKKVIERVLEDPYIPTWTGKKKGMQGTFDLSTKTEDEATEIWLEQLDLAVNAAIALEKTGIHKQNANRLLEPWMYVPVVITGTEFENFFRLRCEESTHPDFRKVAIEMQQALALSAPQELEPGEWHIPFSKGLGLLNGGNSLYKFEDVLRIATARCARLSYATHDGEISVDRDFALHDMLLKDRHWSPLEHSAVAVERKTDKPEYSIYRGVEVNTRNLRGLYSYRSHIEDGMDIR